MATDDAPNLRRLARQLVDVTRRLKHLETVPQLAHSSLDDHGMPVYDADGNLTVTVGKQPDGTWGAKPVAGPVPPRPVGLDAEGDAGAIRASWQGVFWAGAALPMDFEAVQVLVDGSVYAAIHDPEGGSVQVPALPGERLVSFRTLSQAGVVSEAVTFGTVTVEPRVSEQMQELGENLAELRDVTLPELADELDDAASDLQQKLDAANARIDDIIVDGGGAGNFTTYSINEPSGEGTGEGDQWFRVVNGEVLGQWRWDGAAWQAVTLTDAVIAGIDLSKLVGNGGLSEVVANKMFTDIFAANKITSQEIAAGSITTEKIAAEGIIANVIQGGAFTGETFEGGSFVGGEFRTSDTLPGQVTLSDIGFEDPLQTGIPGPGVGVTPRNPDGFTRFPGVGPSWGGMTVSGGRDATGRWATVEASPTTSALRAVDEGGGGSGYIYTSAGVAMLRTSGPDGETGEVRSSPTSARLRTRTAGGALASEVNASPTASFMQTYGDPAVGRAYSQVDPQRATMNVLNAEGRNTARITADGNSVTLFSATNGQRYLKLDDTGIWIETGGKAYNLEETAQDSGWAMATVASGYTAQPNYPPKARKVGNLDYLSGGINGAGISANTSQYVLTLPAGYRPIGNSIYVVGGSSSGAACPLFVIQPDGRVSMRTTNTTGSYYLMDGVSFIPE